MKYHCDFYVVGESQVTEKTTNAQRPGITVEPDHWSLTEQQQEGLTRPSNRMFVDSKSTICQCIACGKVLMLMQVKFFQNHIIVKYLVEIRVLSLLVLI